MSGKDITVAGPDGTFGAYLASPASGHGPGVGVASSGWRGTSRIFSVSIGQ